MIKILNGARSVFYDLDTSYQNGNVVGRISWDQDNATAQIGLTTNTVIRVGQDDVWYVKNQTASLIPKGTVVYASGTVGSSGRITIAPYIADGTIAGRFILGMTTEDIASGADGYVMAKGKLRGFNTSSYAEGTVLWASPTVAGGVTTTEPSAPNIKAEIAFVIHQHTTNGILAVRRDSGSRIFDASDVQISSPSTGQLLRYGTNRWENWTPNYALSGTTITINGTTNQVNVTGGTQDLSGNRTWTLSLPQDIHTGASPTFAGLNVTGNIVSGSGTGSIPTGGGTSTSIQLLRRGTGPQVVAAFDVGTGGLNNRFGIFVNSDLGLYGLTHTYSTGARRFVILTDGGTERLTITSDGRLGLATSTPSTTFDVNGGARIRSLSTFNGDFVTADGNGLLSRRTPAETLSDIGAAPASGSANYIQNQTAASQSASMWIGGTAIFDGNVSFGRTSANKKVHIQTSSNEYPLLVQNSSDTLNDWTGIGLRVKIQTADNRTKGAILFQSTSGTNGVGRILFATNDLDDSSNVGLNDWRWSVTSTGILESNGAQTIRTSSGSLTLLSNGSNGDIRLTPNGTGIVYIGTGTKSGIIGRLEIAYDGSANGIGIFNGVGTSFRIYRESDTAYLSRGAVPALAINTASRLIPSVDADGAATNALLLNGSGVMVSRALGTGAFATIADYGLATADITAVGLTTSTLTLTRAAGNLTASIPTWNQNTTGSAATLTTARTLTIGSTGKTFNGSANVSWTLGEIGAVAVAGGSTITGAGSFRAFSMRTSDASAANWTWFAMGGTSDSAGNVWHIATNGTAIDIGLAGAFHIRGSNGGQTSIAVNQDHSVRFRSSSVFLGATANNNGVQVVTNSGTWAINVSGSAATLTTARTINGTSFNGSANITTENWGTARTITIGSTGKSVNGSAGVTWSWDEIGFPSYVSSRGQNLVTNGTALLASNYNFNWATFDGSDAYSSNGSFKDSTFNTNRESNEFIPVDVDSTYRLSVWAKQNPYVGARYYIGVTCYDADNLQITANHHMYVAGSLTTLAAPLNVGDTQVFLTSSVNWFNGGTAGVSTHLRSIIFWDYVNSYGYAFPELTYSRNWLGNAWDPGGINTSTHVITLRVPYAGPAKPAGTKLSNGSSGGTYKYIAASNAQIPATWTNYQGTIGTVDTTGTNVTNRFAPATAKVKLLFLNNRDTAGATIWYSNINFGLDYATAGNFVPNTRSLTFTTNNGITGGSTALDLSTNRSWTFGLTGQALALHNLATNGIIVRTGSGTVAARTLVAGSGVSITNADGVSGNITISATGSGGTVTSITAGFGLSGGTITSSGTISLNAGLGDLNNVVIGTPSDGHYLRYTTGVNKWVNTAISASDIASGTLVVGRGGTGATTLTGVVIGNGTSAMTAVAGTASQLFRRNAANNAYEFFTHDFINQAGARTAISLTTTGSSGAATYNNSTGVLNVPNYTLTGLGGVPTSRTININGTTQDLAANRTFNISTLQRGSLITTQDWDSITTANTLSMHEVAAFSGANGPPNGYTYGALIQAYPENSKIQLYFPEQAGASGRKVWYRSGYGANFGPWYTFLEMNLSTNIAQASGPAGTAFQVASGHGYNTQALTKLQILGTLSAHDQGNLYGYEWNLENFGSTNSSGVSLGLYGHQYAVGPSTALILLSRIRNANNVYNHQFVGNSFNLYHQSASGTAFSVGLPNLATGNGVITIGVHSDTSAGVAPSIASQDVLWKVLHNTNTGGRASLVQSASATHELRVVNRTTTGTYNLTLLDTGYARVRVTTATSGVGIAVALPTGNADIDGRKFILEMQTTSGSTSGITALTSNNSKILMADYLASSEQSISAGSVATVIYFLMWHEHINKWLCYSYFVA